MFSRAIISGTIPVILSCITQYWFKWYGPYEFLNGLIVWYQKAPPDINNTEFVTGLFNNPNYTGTWLSVIFPLSVYELKVNKKTYLKL